MFGNVSANFSFLITIEMYLSSNTRHKLSIYQKPSKASLSIVFRSCACGHDGDRRSAIRRSFRISYFMLLWQIALWSTFYFILFLRLRRTDAYWSNTNSAILLFTVERIKEKKMTQTRDAKKAQ